MGFIQFSWSNLFWHYLIYGLGTWVVMRFIPGNKRKKILTPVNCSIQSKILSISSMSLRTLAMVLSLFIPVSMGAGRFYAGIFIYVTGLILTTLAMWQFSQADMDEPITTGIYKISRHPMQVMYSIMVIGIAVVSNNLIFWMLIVFYMAVSYFILPVQESYCIEKYGENYSRYRNKTPRILFFNSR